MPPALVATSPPMLALPRAARSMPGSSPASAASAWACSRVTPASRSRVWLAASSRCMRFSLRSEQHVAGLRGAAADQAGESALGHQGASRLAAQTHHGSDLVGAFRQDQEASGEVLRMVAGVLPGERGTVAHAAGAEDLAEGAVEFGIVHGGLRVRDGRARLAAPRRSADGPPGRRAAVRAGARDRARVRRRSRSRGRWRGSPGCRYRPRAE